LEYQITPNQIYEKVDNDNAIDFYYFNKQNVCISWTLSN
jgi:hypothetical protein